MAAEPDIWSKWLLDGRSGGDPELRRKILESLRPIRDRVIEGARIGAGARVLDADCGDGMIGFGILEKYPDAFVVFSDISEALLEMCHGIATDAGWRERCDFVLGDVQALAKIADASVDAVTLRSVLIYVPDKLAAHREFHRVLRPGGHLSYFEPINAMGRDNQREGGFWGYAVGPVGHLASKVAAVFAAFQGPGDPMMNFQERDLLDFAEDAGFEHVHLAVDLDFGRVVPGQYRLSWDQWLKQSGNPKIPSVGEAIRRALTPDEQAEFEAHMRPQIESGRGLFRNGRAFLTATKAGNLE